MSLPREDVAVLVPREFVQRAKPVDEARFVEAVRLGEAQLERGEYVSHEEVGQRIKRLSHP